MRVFRELEEIQTLQEKLDSATDSVLELYKKYPKECKELLSEISDIDTELKTLNIEFLKHV
jgi:predicted  nucleic acid-binding Zn-ribbon protein